MISTLVLETVTRIESALKNFFGHLTFYLQQTNLISFTLDTWKLNIAKQIWDKNYGMKNELLVFSCICSWDSHSHSHKCQEVVHKKKSLAFDLMSLNMHDEFIMDLNLTDGLCELIPCAREKLCASCNRW
jgi:hypothetical protein